MNTQKSRFESILGLVLVLLFLLTLAALIYPELANNPEPPNGGLLALNLLILSIPLMLLYGSIFMIALAWREHALSGQVEPRLAKIIHWAPRVAAILITIFLSLFSLDVFEMQASPLELLGGFLIHNLPSLAMIVLLVLAWRRPAVGFVAFLVAGVLFAVLFVRNFYALPNLLLFVLPILAIASLFYIDWKWLGTPPTRSAQQVPGG